MQHVIIEHSPLITVQFWRCIFQATS